MHLLSCTSPHPVAYAEQSRPDFASRARTVSVNRRRTLLGALLASLSFSSEASAELSCRGLRGYDLRQCLREKRSAALGTDDEIRQEYLKTRQFEQPGELVTLPNGLQYREIETGQTGKSIEAGAVCEISYIVYRLSSGAYFKYSSGGTPIYMFSLGYGYEGKDDLDSVYQFKYGDNNVLPLAVALGMSGMHVGGRRRVLVPPRLGWVSAEVGPKPDTFGGFRRLEAHKDEPLLFEVELKRMQLPSLSGTPQQPPSIPDDVKAQPFTLPIPPSPTQR